MDDFAPSQLFTVPAAFQHIRLLAFHIQGVVHVQLVHVTTPLALQVTLCLQSMCMMHDTKSGQCTCHEKEITSAFF